MHSNSIKISTISRAKSYEIPQDLTFSKNEIISFINSSKEEVATKETAKSFIACHFKGKKRLAENIDEITMLVLDIDNDLKEDYITSEEELKKVLRNNLAEYDYICYSTKRNTKVRPRARAILFLTNPINKEKYKNAAKNFIDTLDDKLKDALEIESTLTINKLWLLPFKTESDSEIFCINNVGKPLDLNCYYEEGLTHLTSIALENNTAKEPQLNQLVKSQPLNINKEEIKEGLQLYKAENLDNSEWFEVLTALHHQFEGSEEGLKIANYWSSLDKRPDQYGGVDHVKAVWQRLDKDKTNVKTWATIKMKINKLKIKIKINENLTNLLIKITPYMFPEPNQYLTEEGKVKYKPKCTENNTNYLFDFYNIKFRFNVIVKQIEAIHNEELICEWELILRRVSGMFAINDFSTREVQLHIIGVAKNNPYNPFKELVLSREWDGKDRLKDLYSSITVEDNHIQVRDIFVYHWLLELIKLTCFNDDNDYKFTRSLLVFQGKQKIGKTEWFNHLLPVECRRQFFRDGEHLKIDDAMSKLNVLTVAICELGEFGQTMRKQDMDALKAFISKRHDTINRKYIASHQEYRRTTIFCASVNEATFLNDSTGNSRFLVLPIIKCNAFHHIDMQQVYAQLYKIYEKDGPYELTDKHIAMQNDINSSVSVECPITNKFNEYFNFECETRPNFMNCSEIISGLGYNDEFAARNRKYLSLIANLCKNNNLKRCSKKGKYYLPPINKTVF